MKKKEIIDFLRSYGIYEQCDGFDYLIEVIDYAVKNREFNVAKIISIVAKKYGKNDNSIRNQLRYCVTMKNYYGGRLTVKEVVKSAIRKTKEKTDETN